MLNLAQQSQEKYRDSVVTKVGSESGMAMLQTMADRGSKAPPCSPSHKNDKKAKQHKGQSGGSHALAATAPARVPLAPRNDLGEGGMSSTSTEKEMPSSVRAISFAEEMNARYRCTMEDSHTIIDGYGSDPQTGFFGIYDGHGGRGVAEYLRTHLHKNIEEELRRKGSRSVEECIKAAYLLTDINCSKTRDPASGATSITCIVRKSKDRKYIYTANCGDARAVLCHNRTAVRLSKDHKATDDAEISRIEAANGFVLRRRVMGVLAVARSFGDYALKKYVPAEPFTSTTKLGEKSQFVIIACDGVWDVLSDQEAVNFVRLHFGKEVVQGEWTDTQAKQAQSAAKALARHAVKRGSTDNVTVIVVVL